MKHDLIFSLFRIFSCATSGCFIFISDNILRVLNHFIIHVFVNHDQIAIFQKIILISYANFQSSISTRYLENVPLQSFVVDNKLYKYSSLNVSSALQ